MSDQPKIYNYKSMKKMVQRLKDDLRTQDFVLLFAYNGTGKTRLSMDFKDEGKKKVNRSLRSGDRAGQALSIEDVRSDTLYFNAYTEDLFSWDNDLDGDAERVLKINSDSKFFSGFKEMALEGKISTYLERYADFDFRIDYEQWTINFSRGDNSNIKVSRGEENIFIFCIYLAICELVLDGEKAYDWVKYLYIDDPISSLDDNNAIAVACDLAKLLLRGKNIIKSIISSHHSLFFNVMCNELKKTTHKKYFLHTGNDPDSYTLRATTDTPFFHHVAMLSELRQASESGELYTHHFNMLRGILEKTATFFGHNDFSTCIHGVDDEVLYARTLNLLSHGKYSVFEPKEMVPDTKELFRKILNAFLKQYSFKLPDIFANELKEVNKP